MKKKLYSKFHEVEQVLFFFLFLDCVHNSPKKNERSLTKKRFITSLWRNVLSCRAQRVILSGQDSAILPTRVANH